MAMLSVLPDFIKIKEDGKNVGSCFFATMKWRKVDFGVGYLKL